MTQVNEVNGTLQARRPRSPLRRAGCTVLLILWFLLLLAPCFCIVLATQGEIVIPQGSAPGQAIRIWLIMEADQRGLGVASSSVMQEQENTLCVESNTRFLLWSGSAEPISSCECYERARADEQWSLLSVSNEACSGE
jgi:hypothetical protein